MVGHHRHPVVAHFLVASRVAAGETVPLGRDGAHHVRVLRLVPGDRVGLTDGSGLLAVGTLATLTRSSALVRVDDITIVPRPHEIHLLVPVADRERMLWLAEKSVELQAASWRPVHWHRSASVTARGAGPAFTARVRAWMTAALAQSRGAWLPDIHDAVAVEGALRQAPPGTRIVLDPDGAPLLAAVRWGVPWAVTIAVGPEGGFEEDELTRLATAGFVRASLGDTILRFETAGVAALAAVRAVVSVSAATPLDNEREETGHGE
jgi:16S rRNA (uracil1498-N3)-methyltransferase